MSISETDTIKPSIALLSKLGSIARHIEEYSETGHPMDLNSAIGVQTDQEIRDWMIGMDKLSLLPIKR